MLPRQLASQGDNVPVVAVFEEGLTQEQYEESVRRVTDGGRVESYGSVGSVHRTEAGPRVCGAQTTPASELDPAAR
jgi:hypothetical protein